MERNAEVTEESRATATEFFNSWRGRYIVGQALYLAVQEIESRPSEKQEPSNVADMKYLMDNLFPLFKATQGSFVDLALEKLNEDQENTDEPTAGMDSTTNDN